MCHLCEEARLAITKYHLFIECANESIAGYENDIDFFMDKIISLYNIINNECKDLKEVY